MKARRGTPGAGPASPRIDGFAAAKTATPASAAAESSPVKLRRLQKLDTEMLRVVASQCLSCLVCFVFIDSYGRGGGVGRGLGVGAILGVGVTRGVAVGVGVGLSAAAQYLPPVFK